MLLLSMWTYKWSHIRKWQWLIHPPLANMGDTVRMILDFTTQTIEFIINDAVCSTINMVTAGIGDGQPLKVAMSCHRDGGHIRILEAAATTTIIMPATISPS